jgi:uncharacterized damage-inducible protein DinB
MHPQQAEFLVEFLLPRMEQEQGLTRRVLAAVPEECREYRPHAAARSALELAWHMAASEIWYLDGVLHGHFAPEQPRMPPHIRTIAGVCSFHERNVPSLIDELRAAPAGQFTQEIDCDGHAQCAAAILLGCLMHTAHHRGQLSAYLRAIGAKVPPIYGGSADEPFHC